MSTDPRYVEERCMVSHHDGDFRMGNAAAFYCEFEKGHKGLHFSQTRHLTNAAGQESPTPMRWGDEARLKEEAEYLQPKYVVTFEGKPLDDDIAAAIRRLVRGRK